VEALVNTNPDLWFYRFILGEVYTYLGQVRAEQNHTVRARIPLEQAIVLQKPLAAQHPELVSNTITLFESYSIVAILEREAGHADDARKTLGDSVSRTKQFFESQPLNNHRRVYLQALQESTLIDFARGADTPAQRIALLDILRDQEEFTRAHPEDSIVRCAAVEFALALAQPGETNRAPAVAIENLDRADALIAPGLEITPDHPRLRSRKSRLEVMRGTELLRAGKSNEAKLAATTALAIAEKLAAEDPSYLFDLACALALKARLDPADPAPPAAAVAALRKAIEFGFDNVYKLKNDQHLAPIRPREDFQTLLQDLERSASASVARSQKDKR
jgi:hypothetical protein